VVPTLWGRVRVGEKKKCVGNRRGVRAGNQIEQLSSEELSSRVAGWLRKWQLGRGDGKGKRREEKYEKMIQVNGESDGIRNPEARKSVAWRGRGQRRFWVGFMREQTGMQADGKWVVKKVRRRETGFRFGAGPRAIKSTDGRQALPKTQAP
jgi:hypothetical protein